MREVIPPTGEPLTLTEVRIHLRQQGDVEAGGSPPVLEFESMPDDSWVTAKITAARQWAENFLGFPLTDAVYEEGFDTVFGDRLPDKCSPWVISSPTWLALPDGYTQIVSLHYLDAANTLQTIAPSAYSFDEFNRRIYVDEEPAVSTDRAKPVRVRFQGSYTVGDDTASPPLVPVQVPESVKHAMLLFIGDLYAHRGDDDARDGGDSSITLQRLEGLLRPYRQRLGMA